ncbi:MAG TPA: RDD family protein [Pseudonocardiaceae bacterium]|nr:RDD family protein [Pseudonocardiaceae bacterium]
MSRWTQTWLSGTHRHPEDGDPQDYPGQRLGLPESGPGSAAGFGPRIVAIMIDWLPCSVAAQLFTANPAFSALALFAAWTAVSVALIGRSPGHAAMGLRVARPDGRAAGFGPAIIRTVLLCLVIPPVVYNADGRGLHDLAADTIVLRTR